jgi:hypothetical protein
VIAPRYTHLIANIFLHQAPGPDCSSPSDRSSTTLYPISPTCLQTRLSATPSLVHTTQQLQQFQAPSKSNTSQIHTTQQNDDHPNPTIHIKLQHQHTVSTLRASNRPNHPTYQPNPLTHKQTTTSRRPTQAV